MSNERKISRLIYLRKTLDERIDEVITRYLLQDKDIDTEQIRETLMYHIEDNLGAFEQGR